MVGRGERIIGVIKDGQKKWRRVQQNDVLENGWTILQLTPDVLTLGTGTTANRHNGCGNGKEIQMKQWIAALLLMLIPGVQAAKPQK